MLEVIKWNDFRYSRRQFGLWRAAFGLYLVFNFIGIYPYASELYSSEGPFAHFGFARLTWYPTGLLTFDSEFAVKAMAAACIALSALVMVGFYRRAACFGLWLLVMWQYNRNTFTSSPEYAFVNWLIFACVFIPEGEGFSLGRVDTNWKMPRLFYWGGWIVLSVGYFNAASFKFRLMDPAWIDGSAMYHVLVTDNARREWYGSFFNDLPLWIFSPLTYGALTLETLAPVFVSLRRLRPWWWLAATAAHLGMLTFSNFGQLSLGMLFFHFFLFDAQWLAFRIILE